MEKITNMDQLLETYGASGNSDTLAGMTALNIRNGFLNDENFWQVREQCRINDGTYTPIHIDGDDKMRFLHVSIDDPAKVSYTKDADKGRQDLQTRTTLAAYCEKFGLDMPLSFKDYLGVDDSMPKADQAEVYVRTPAPNNLITIREKLEMIQDLIDEVIADIG